MSIPANMYVWVEGGLYVCVYVCVYVYVCMRVICTVAVQV